VALVASWGDLERQAPELTALARGFLDAFKHKTLATLRRDGSPRISGTELEIADGELWLGSMWRSMKALDLLRDPRFALHSGSPDPDAGWRGDTKLAGRAEDVTAPDATSHRFRLEIEELVVVRLGEPRDHIVIEAWHEGRGVSRRERR
jgi:Pyridoxamine 5'-phosphate oxidase